MIQMFNRIFNLKLFEISMQGGNLISERLEYDHTHTHLGMAHNYIAITMDGFVKNPKSSLAKSTNVFV